MPSENRVRQEPATVPDKDRGLVGVRDDQERHELFTL